MARVTMQYFKFAMLLLGVITFDGQFDTDR